MDRHALLIGIDRYPLLRYVGLQGQVVSKDLQGCVTDAQLMAQVLRERYQFAEGNVSLLLNEQATRDGILRGLEDLLSRVGQDDLVVLFYAGHGSQMADREKTKLSGWDETLVPSDSGRQAQPNRDITDDEIRLWLLRLADKTPYITLIFDCCHSATLHRDAFATGERGLERDERSVDELPPSPLTPEQVLQLAGPNKPNPQQSVPGRWLPSTGQYVVLAGCGARETAKEHGVYTGNQLVRYGALTYFLVDSIRSSPAGATYRDVFERAALEVSKRYDQHPMAEGALDRALFDVKDSPPPIYFLVTKVRAGKVSIAAGQPQGVQLGSEWALFPPGTSELQITNQPHVRITSVGPLSAEGQLLSTDFLIEEYSRAVLALRPVELQWPIELVGTPAPDNAPPEEVNNPGVPQRYIRNQLNNSPWLRLADQGAAGRARIYLLKPRTEVRDGDPVPQLGPLRTETWAVVDAAGELCMKPRHVMQIERLTTNLEKLVRKNFVSELANPESRLADLVDLQILAQQPNGQWSPLYQRPTEVPTVHPGTQLAMELTNRHRMPVYITLLQIEADGTISQVYPPVGTSEPLRAQGTSRIGDGEGNPIRVRFPADLPIRTSGQPPSEVLCGFKLLVTTQPVDLRPLLQEAVRLLHIEFQGSASVLGQLLRTAFCGDVTMRASPTTLSAIDEWTAESRWLQISKQSTAPEY